MASKRAQQYAALTFGPVGTMTVSGRAPQDTGYPVISRSWWAEWAHLTVFFGFPSEIRSVIYTTSTIESPNYSLRHVIKNRGAFPSDDAVLKALHLDLRNVAKQWTRSIQNGAAALNQSSILFGERMAI